MATLVMPEIEIRRDAQIPTWFGVGGCADRFAEVGSEDDVRRCLEVDGAFRVLGDGANLLVDDAGVGELVVSLSHGALAEWSIDADSGLVRVGAGAKLPKLILEAARLGLAGIETLAGIPATVGGAIVMNAGGRFGQISDVVERVRVLDRSLGVREIERPDIDFGYRRSGLGRFVVLSADLRLSRERNPGETRARQLEIMEYKKGSQPMAASSAGCCFKNPTLAQDIEGIGRAGERVSAGLLIDRAGCKGLARGGARVSERHGNFLVAERDGTARDVIGLMADVGARVADRFGVSLEREVVVWERTG